MAHAAARRKADIRNVGPFSVHQGAVDPRSTARRCRVRRSLQAESGRTGRRPARLACDWKKAPTRGHGTKRLQDDFLALLELLREGKIHPVVAERLPLSDARRAHEKLDSSAAKGKLVLVP